MCIRDSYLPAKQQEVPINPYWKMSQLIKLQNRPDFVRAVWSNFCLLYTSVRDFHTVFCLGSEESADFSVLRRNSNSNSTQKAKNHSSKIYVSDN